MRIGPQQYGFQGFEIRQAGATRGLAATAPVVKSLSVASARSGATVTPAIDSAKTLARLKELVTDLRRLVANPDAVTNDTTAQATTALDEVESLATAARSYEVTQTTVEGVNSTQIVGTELNGYDSLEPVIIQGDVTVESAAAQLTIAGDAQAQVTEDATFALTTERGVFQIELAGGESLQQAATRITSDQESTGVAAAVQGTNLVLTNVRVGSAGTISLVRTDVSPTIVSGVNAQQINSVNVLNQNSGASEILSGSIDSQASAAELVYQGANDETIAGGATFRLTGALGEVIVSVTSGESLAAVANRINQQSAATGVAVTQENDTLRFRSIALGEDATVQVDQIVAAETVTTQGANGAQVANFAVTSIERGSQDTITGAVLTTAGKASLVLQGSAQGKVSSTATFELSGSLGTASITITKDEDLSAVAARINDQSGSTGVTAQIETNQILLESTEYGSAATIEVDLLSLPYVVAVSTPNAAQITNFEVQSFDDGATHTFTGNITRAAEAAEFEFRGLGVLVNKNATFTLTGELGSRQFTTTTLQTLANLASNINQETANTGVSATVSGDRIYFRSVDVGSDVEINLQVNSGTFNINGDNANGSAYGVNARATLNGTVINALGNDFNFSNAKGSYSFSTVQGFTGTITPITVTSTAGSFNLSGGDGSGVANGTDATAIINGVQQTGAGNTFAVTTANGQYSLDFAADFVGAFEPITVASELDDFSLSGGDSNGADTGTDFIATINNTEYRGISNTVTHTTANGSYELDFSTTQLGQFDPIQISTSAGPTVLGGDGNGSSIGVDAVATINGVNYVGNGTRINYESDRASLTLDLAAGFVGNLDVLTIRTTTKIVTERASGEEAERTSFVQRSVSAEQQSLASILAEIDQLAVAESNAESAPDEEASSEAEEPADATAAITEPATRSELVSRLFKALAANGLTRDNSAAAQLRQNLALLKNSVDLSG